MDAACNTFLMVRPGTFRFNTETADTNIFQSPAGNNGEQAAREFDQFVNLLRKNFFEVLLFHEPPGTNTPDCLFPNNWLATLNLKIYLFPMLAPNRRNERQMEIVNALKKKFGLQSDNSLVAHENENMFLEGTGAMVLDRKNKIAYANISSRCNETLFLEFCRSVQFTPVKFRAHTLQNAEVYHTNVLMSIGRKTAVLCTEMIQSQYRESVVSCLKKTHALIEITSEQVFEFAGNLLYAENIHGKKFWIMSQRAFTSLSRQQRELLSSDGEIIYSDLQHIEIIGGGSARCMIAEIYRS